MSASKGVVALLCAVLRDQGRVDIDAPVAELWPEFAVEGKDRTTLRTILSHRAGLPILEGEFDWPALLDARRMANQLAGQRPLWTPGTSYLYHPITFGWLVGEILLRATGSTVGTLLNDVLAEPLGLDVRIGTPEAELDRVATLHRSGPKPGTSRTPPSLDEHDVRWQAGHRHPPIAPTVENYNRRLNLLAELAGVNAVATARGLAGLYATCIDPAEPILTRGTLRDSITDHTSALTPFIGEPVRFGAGFQLPTPQLPMLSPASFGHVGGGGATAFADLAHGVAFGYVPNRLVDAPGADVRPARVVAALRSVLAAWQH